MMKTVTEQFSPAVEALKADLAKIEEKVVLGTTLSDVMRLGATTTTEYRNWGSGTNACAMSAAAVGLAALGYTK